MANNSSIPSGQLMHYASYLWEATLVQRANFYMVTPAETTFAEMNEVPDFVAQSVPFWFALMFLEIVIARCLGKRTSRINDSLSSFSSGMLQQMTKVLVMGFEASCYTYVYNNYHVLDLPWDSRWLWWLCIFGYDLGYYFAHRAGHEINFLWAAHQVHHSSESYNLTTALRQSIFQGLFFWVFYIPLALVIPPSIFKAHAQFNLIYQFWIHTELIDNLGPLEWVLNTPSHHRVHHGRNEKCLDKNYAAVFIIWDRLFGTFQAEPKERDVAYGLVYPLDFWDPISAQIHYYQYILTKAWNAKGISVKLQLLFRGPGWTPSGEEVVPLPEVQYPVKPFNKNLSLLLSLYTVLHHGLLLPGYMQIATGKIVDTQLLWLSVAYVVLALTSVGMMFDHKWYAPGVEVFRLSLVLLLVALPATAASTGFFFPGPLNGGGQAVFAASTLLWLGLAARHWSGGRPYWQQPPAKKAQ